MGQYGMQINFPLDYNGMWREILVPPNGVCPRPGLFIDRDGTIIELVNYLSNPRDVCPIDDAITLIVEACSKNIPVVMVTNQSGISRGYYDWEAFAKVQAAVITMVTKVGGAIHGIYACSALPNSNAHCRKPNPGMLLAGAEDLLIDLPNSWIVGDTANDLLAGKKAGLNNGWLVQTGYGKKEVKKALTLSNKNFSVITNRPLTELSCLLPTYGKL